MAAAKGMRAMTRVQTGGAAAWLRTGIIGGEVSEEEGVEVLVLLFGESGRSCFV